MNQDDMIMIEFDKIKSELEEYAVTEYGKNRIRNLTPMLNEIQVEGALTETQSARRIIDYAGNPPLPTISGIQLLLEIAAKEGLLYPEQLEKMQIFTASCRRMKSYLKRAEASGVGMAFAGANMDALEEVYLEINRCIRGEDIDSNASGELSRIRRQMEQTEQKIRARVDELLKQNKKYLAEQFMSVKNGHFTIPVKKEYKNQISGSVITVSGTGSTCFIEPVSVARLVEELDGYKMAESVEKNRILYELTALVYQYEKPIRKNIELLESMDFAFAKGKYSASMDGVSPTINTVRQFKIVQGRHPLLKKEECVPLDFETGTAYRGVIITGPNTGGKTVCLKLIGLFAAMAQCGLHVPCQKADLCLNSNILCDIGDGQNISQNLSTFSAHITNVIRILKHTGRESLVLLDELGSGTDPQEGMGLAIAILSELKRRGCLFVVTTHYAEIKTYAEDEKEMINARMTFDRETLKPLYQLVIGEAGESCAFYIAKRLGLSEVLLQIAKRQTKGHIMSAEQIDQFFEEYEKKNPQDKKASNSLLTTPKVQKRPKEKQISEHAQSFEMGDSVIVYPDKKVGIVYEASDDNGMVTVQIQGRKRKVNHKRLKIKAKASELYPADYDFSIIFDSVETRKARHQMDRKYCENLEIRYEKEIDEK